MSERTRGTRGGAANTRKGPTNKGPLTERELEMRMERAEEDMVAGAFDRVVLVCGRILARLPAGDARRADALEYLGVAHAMLQNFYDSYDAYTEALSLRPDDAALWYNRGISARFCGRTGQSARDLERAVALEGRGEMARPYAEELRFSEKLAKQSRRLRGRGFTLDDLIVQEEVYQRAVRAMEAEAWDQADEGFRRAIAMGDCLPQPWGNLGACLIMRERYDEAEAALRRALELDPEYEHARRNLAVLAETRASGKPVGIALTEPFKTVPIRKSLAFRVGE